MDHLAAARDRFATQLATRCPPRRGALRLSRLPLRRELLELTEGKRTLAGRNEKEVCRRLGTPGKVDGSEWRYTLPATRPGRLIVKFEDARVNATRTESLRYPVPGPRQIR